MLTDTHCHLFYEQIKNDLESVLERSRKLGVNRFICVATNLNDAEECLELSQRYDCIYASAGIHPHDSKDAPSNFKEKIYDFMKNEKMVALGEWRDYGISILKDFSIFSIYRHSSEHPIYKVKKMPQNSNKREIFSVIAMDGKILKRGNDLDRILNLFGPKILRIVKS